MDLREELEKIYNRTPEVAETLIGDLHGDVNPLAGGFYDDDWDGPFDDEFDDYEPGLAIAEEDLPFPN